MPQPTSHKTVHLLSAVARGDQDAGKQLFSLVYKELHALAHAVMRREPSGSILQTTALVHEAYLHLLPDRRIEWQDRKHFFTTAARAMRRILIDEARKRKTTKRGKGAPALSLDEGRDLDQLRAGSRLTFEALDDLDLALQKMEAQEHLSRLCETVELLFFAELTQDQAAEVLGVSKGTVRRDWEFAKAWLQQEMKGYRRHDG